MRTLVPILAACLTLSVGGAGVRAEKRTTRTAPDDAPELPAPEKQVSWTDVWRAELQSIRSVADGSPVRARHEQTQRRKLAPNKRERKELAAFRASQTGPFDALIADAAERWGLDPFLLKGLLENESRLDPALIGKRIYKQVRGKRVAVGGGARGIAQFTTSGIEAVNEAREKRHRRGEFVQPFEPDDVWDPVVAIPASAELLASYIRRFGRDGGITAYNSGPYGGRLVQKHGFERARRTGKLSRVGDTALQGHRFLVNVLRHTNRFRKQAGLPRLPGPARGVETKRDRLERLKQRWREGKPNT